MRAAIYARVSTLDQEPENQLVELRRYVDARGWAVTEYTDHGVSGAKDRRPALDRLRADARRRKFDVLVCWRLDRLGRNLKHLISLLDDLQALGVAFVSLAEGIDATTPAGKLQMHILGAISEFERGRYPRTGQGGPGAGQKARKAARAPGGCGACGSRLSGGWTVGPGRRGRARRVTVHAQAMAATGGSTNPRGDGLTFATEQARFSRLAWRVPWVRFTVFSRRSRK